MVGGPLAMLGFDVFLGDEALIVEVLFCVFLVR